MEDDIKDQFINCPKCGAKYFSVVPGKTTKEEIIAFLENRGEDSSEAWLHPGLYCPGDCKSAILVSYHMNLPSEVTDQTYQLLLHDLGEKEKEVILYLKQKLGSSLSETKDLIQKSDYPITLDLGSGSLWETQNIRNELIAIGASITIPNEPQTTFEQTLEEKLDQQYPSKDE